MIKAEFDRRMALPNKKKSKLVRRMREYAAAVWQTAEKVHLLMLDDEQPENEKQRLDPDHWWGKKIIYLQCDQIKLFDSGQKGTPKNEKQKDWIKIDEERNNNCLESDHMNFFIQQSRTLEATRSH